MKTYIFSSSLLLYAIAQDEVHQRKKVLFITVFLYNF